VHRAALEVRQNRPPRRIDQFAEVRCAYALYP